MNQAHAESHAFSGRIRYAYQWTMGHLYVTSPSPAGSTFLLAASARDADEDELTYTWDYGDGTAPLIGTQADSAHEPSYVFTTPGIYTVQVSVDDDWPGGVIQDALTVEVTSAPPVPPTITRASIPATVTAGTSVTFSATAHDPQGTALSYDWRFKHESGSLFHRSGSRVVEAIPARGVWLVELEVANAGGLSASANALMLAR